MAHSKVQAAPEIKYELSGVTWTKVNAISELVPGDHISYWGPWSTPYWHHAIVDDVDRVKNVISIILWSLLPPKIVKRDLQLSIGSGPQLHKAAYTKGCHDNVEVLRRARSRIGETEYHLISNFARAFPEWCKTGRGRLTHDNYDSDCRYKTQNSNEKPVVVEASAEHVSDSID